MTFRLMKIIISILIVILGASFWSITMNAELIKNITLKIVGTIVLYIGFKYLLKNVYPNKN
ncbi:hypothetical protein ABD90_03110 [Lysinibacillus fusiformis]|uniref:Uncharacterized protein n=2 Tax=Lysinibacillus sphaericus TaxID=1421 RepID=W7S1P3_LYSSH|nr:hypothetical protein AR327_09365 [Lysinibacillus sphaericus]EWH33530.1 hypothetical protein P799_15310 [Lysinibacillus sphaericus CBAM5]MBG9724295.1 hypothetical protein [Lysinibacillus fusiformis]AMR92276.1 hypothetical protein A1T07_19845 [Lysinibacillus sphaericus]ANA46325.1 hypothetical protein A2J09_12515 [Lysinibacillus sphaericus]